MAVPANLVSSLTRWSGDHEGLPPEIDFEWALAALMRGLIIASPIFIVALLRSAFRKRQSRHPFGRPRDSKDSVVLSGPRAPGHLLAAVRYYRAFLKARIGEDWDISWQTGAKIAQCYLGILEFLSQGTRLPEEDISVIRHRIEGYDALTDKLNGVLEAHGEIRLWTGSHESIRSALSDDIVTGKFSFVELLYIRDALEEFGFALRAFEEDSSRTEDDELEIGDDTAFYRYAHEQTVEALKRMSDEISSKSHRAAERTDAAERPAPGP